MSRYNIHSSAFDSIPLSSDVSKNFNNWSRKYSVRNSRTRQIIMFDGAASVNATNLSEISKLDYVFWFSEANFYFEDILVLLPWRVDDLSILDSLTTKNLAKNYIVNRLSETTHVQFNVDAFVGRMARIAVQSPSHPLTCPLGINHNSVGGTCDLQLLMHQHDGSFQILTVYIFWVLLYITLPFITGLLWAHNGHRIRAHK